MIEVGKRAPDFTLMSDTVGRVCLKEFLGKKVIIFFYPKDLTPGCTTESCDFRDCKSDFDDLNTVIIGVSRDSVERHQKFRTKHDLSCLLLADIDGLVCEQYGVWQEKSMYGKKFMGIVRTTYIIDEKGKVAYVFPKVRVKGHVNAVLDILRT